jgi:hypothetical protein
MFGAEGKEEKKVAGTPYYPLGFPMKPPREVNRTLRRRDSAVDRSVLLRLA